MLARIDAGFEEVVNALTKLDIASGIYYEVLPTSPRTAVAVGEKYFIRASNSLAAATILVEASGYTYVKVIATGAREGILDFLDLGSSRDYARMIVEKLAEEAGSSYTILAEAHHLDAFQAQRLWLHGA